MTETKESGTIVGGIIKKFSNKLSSYQAMKERRKLQKAKRKKEQELKRRVIEANREYQRKYGYTREQQAEGEMDEAMRKIGGRRMGQVRKKE